MIEKKEYTWRITALEADKLGRNKVRRKEKLTKKCFLQWANSVHVCSYLLSFLFRVNLFQFLGFSSGSLLKFHVSVTSCFFMYLDSCSENWKTFFWILFFCYIFIFAIFHLRMLADVIPIFQFGLLLFLCSLWCLSIWSTFISLFCSFLCLIVFHVASLFSSHCCLTCFYDSS